VPLSPPTSPSLDVVIGPASETDAFESRAAQVLQEMLDGIDDAQVTLIPLSTTSSADPSNIPPSAISPSDPPHTPAGIDQDPTHAFASPLSSSPSRTTVAHFFVEAMRNTWSRAARRKARAKAHTRAGPDFAAAKGESSPGEPGHPLPTGGTGTGLQERTGPALSCSVRVVRVHSVNAAPETAPVATGVGARKPPYELELEFQWVFGKDRALFEGFTSHVGRKVTAALTIPSYRT
jgi:hypothetical protein